MDQEEMQHHEQIEVVVTYAGAPPHRQYQHLYSPDTTVGQVKTAALDFYGLKPGPDGQGGQIIFYLFQEHERLNDNERIAKLAHGDHLKLRLVREVIAG
jgi:hypothetical protein